MAQIQSSSCFFQGKGDAYKLKISKLKQNKMGFYELATKAEILIYSGNKNNICFSYIDF